MITIFNSSITIPQTGTILQSLVDGGIFLAAPCAGLGTCNKCHITICSGEVTGDIVTNSTVRACRALPIGDVTIQLPELNPRLTILRDGECSEVSDENAAIAIDLGTTTIVATLLNTQQKGEVCTVSALNDQRILGSDVMSRISAAMRGRTELLHKIVIDQLNKMIGFLKRLYHLNTIRMCVVSANTVMLHLLLNVDPSPLGKYPYTPIFTHARVEKGLSYNLDATQLCVLPTVSGYIGADALSCMHLSGVKNATRPILTIDLGTNGELSLNGTDGKIYCCSAASGPALEGASITCGMGGVDGAIDHVYYDGSLQFTTIGNKAPLGICGSGLIDLIAVLLKLGHISKDGLLEKDFSITDSVYLTRGDVRQFQLVKSALKSGVSLLAQQAGIALADVDHVVLTGGIGLHLNPNSVFDAGLLPLALKGKVILKDNLSLRGAVQCVINENLVHDYAALAKQCKVIDLASMPSFLDAFAENMRF